ncbi:MAG: hypothetical protein FWH12_07545 [Treponema sp.]|nr:hypothetical protein [Treponema sp.]
MKRTLPLVLALLCLWALTSCTPRQTPGPGGTASGPRVLIDYLAEGGAFELPLSGATGYAGINIPFFQNASSFSGFLGSLDGGQGFTIIREEGEWWHIEVNGVRGWVMHQFCFINLPDIIPSIVYDITNTYYSLFRSSELDIPNITGMALYEGYGYNPRLGRDEYIAPVLYAMAPKVFAAQQAALAEGHTLMVIEAFRPAAAHNLLHEHFSYLVETNPMVRAGITADNFNIRWFLAEAPYNHQRGTAVDMSLAAIDAWTWEESGNYRYVYVTEYSEYPMQTQMHELSVAAAVFDSSVHARSTTAWIGQPLSPLATTGTILMQRYATDAALTPLASEWWHFNDLELTAVAIELDITGEFFLDKVYSREPLFN